jgi:hypothetical protein
MLLNHKQNLIKRALDISEKHKLKYPINMPSKHKPETNMIPTKLNLRKDIETNKLQDKMITDTTGGSFLFKSNANTALNQYRQKLAKSRLQANANLYNLRVNNGYFKAIEPEIKPEEQKNASDVFEKEMSRIVNNIKNNIFTNDTLNLLTSFIDSLYNKAYLLNIKTLDILLNATDSLFIIMQSSAVTNKTTTKTLPTINSINGFLTQINNMLLSMKQNAHMNVSNRKAVLDSIKQEQTKTQLQPEQIRQSYADFVADNTYLNKYDKNFIEQMRFRLQRNVELNDLEKKLEESNTIFRDVLANKINSFIRERAKKQLPALINAYDDNEKELKKFETDITNIRNKTETLKKEYENFIAKIPEKLEQQKKLWLNNEKNSIYDELIEIYNSDATPDALKPSDAIKAVFVNIVEDFIKRNAPLVDIINVDDGAVLLSADNIKIFIDDNLENLWNNSTSNENFVKKLEKKNNDFTLQIRKNDDKITSLIIKTLNIQDELSSLETKINARIKISERERDLMRKKPKNPTTDVEGDFKEDDVDLEESPLPRRADDRVIIADKIGADEIGAEERKDEYINYEKTTKQLLMNKFSSKMKTEFYNNTGQYISQANKPALWDFLMQNYPDKIKKSK